MACENDERSLKTGSVFSELQTHTRVKTQCECGIRVPKIGERNLMISDLGHEVDALGHAGDEGRSKTTKERGEPFCRL